MNLFAGGRSVRRNLSRVITLTSAVTLVVACGAFVAFDVITFRGRVVSDLVTLSDLVGKSCSGALAFDDSTSATETLRALAAMPHIERAELSRADGRKLTEYTRKEAGASLRLALPSREGQRFIGNRLVVGHAIRLDGERIGSLVVTSDLTELNDRLARYAGVGLIVLLISIGLAFLVAARVQRIISGPILRLADAARRVRDHQDYAVRVTRTGQDELGFLTDSFNSMLADIEARDLELQRTQTDLKGHVEQLEIEIGERERTQEALRRSEEQLVQAMKMEAVGKLAGGVAHDFNNLLTAIKGYGQLLQRRLEAGTPQRVHAEEILKAADRAAALTRQLLAFSRKQILAPEVMTLNEVVANLERMLHRLIGEDVELQTVLASTLGNVKADRGQVEQVVLNLIVNARDAMPKGGRLVLETGEQFFDLALSAQHPGAAPGPYCFLSVTDDGVGMSREVQARVFEPFFTTKEAGKGTGLGLSTVHGIVHQSGGFVSVYSEPGQGTTFRVYLPRVAEARAESLDAAVVAAPRRGTENVFVVEDEPLIRELIRETLVTEGYRVRTAADGREALDEFEAGRCADIHLLLTDVVMPRLNGRELHDRAVVLCPDLKVLFMSGYSEAAIVNNGVLDQGIAFLAKPFSPDDLLHKLRSIMDKEVRNAAA